MTTPTSLYDYYQGQGKLLPTTAEGRFADPSFASAAKTAGYTSANYSVSANNGAANTAILQQLLKGESTKAVTSTSGFNPQTDAQRTAAESASKTYGSTTPYVSSSASVLTQENDTTNQLKSLMGQMPDYKNLLTDYQNSTDTIANYNTQLEARRKAATEGITKQYEQDKAATESAQAKETGSTNVAITRLGGYLGGSGSGGGVMENLAVTHRAELGKLATARDAAIQAANNAIDDKQFSLAQEKINLAKQMTQDIYTRQKDFFNNAINLQGEFRAEKDQKAQDIKNVLDGISTIASSGLDVSVNPEDAAAIDAHYGVPGFTAAYADAANKAAQVASVKDAQEAQKLRMDTMKSYVDLLESVPAGTQIPFGSETITGIGKTSDISTFQIEDANGNVRLVNYNKGSGEITTTNLGAIGKGRDPSTGGGTESERAAKVVSQAQSVLVPGAKLSNGTPVFDGDGHITPPAWRELLNGLQSGGVDRKSSIQQFGYLLQNEGGDVSTGYGLTPAEKKLIMGELPS